MNHIDDTLAKGDTTEAFDMKVARIDLVGAAANGTGFLFTKGDGTPSLLDTDQVRELITKTEGAPMQTDTATAAEAEPVEKADGPDLDVTVTLAETDTPKGANELIPGSPAWEAVDAATAEKWVGVLTRAGHAIHTLAEREDIEAIAGNSNGGMAAFELGEARLAIDYAIGVLARHAGEEKAEADFAIELEAITKAIGSLGGDTLDTIEQQSPLVKAGRVLSSKNEALLRSAGENLTTVLAALPSAPESVEKKESTVTDTTTPEPVEKADEPTTDAPASDAPAASDEDVAKADKTMTAVFNQEGKLIGVVKPEQIVSVEGGGAAAPPAADEPEASDLDPAPAAEAGTATDAPADEELVEKSTNSTDDSSPEALVKAANDGEDALAKSLASIVTAQSEQIELLKALPAQGGPIASGAPVPDARNLRGQADGASAPAGEAAALKKALADAATPAEREAAAAGLQALAKAEYDRVRISEPLAR